MEQYRRVKISKDVLANFFIEQQGKCFGVSKGLPDDAKLLRLQYNQKEGLYIGTFSSKAFDVVKLGDTIPFVDVEYTAFQMMPKEEADEFAKNIETESELGNVAPH